MGRMVKKRNKKKFNDILMINSKENYNNYIVVTKPKAL